jgi:hypothetical protein
MRKAFRFVLLALCLVLLGAAIVGYLYIKTLGPRSKGRIIQALEDRFDADVDLKSLQVSVLPHPGVTVTGLTVKHRHWSSHLPLIYVRQFSAYTSFGTLLSRGDQVDLVKLEGLVIYLPRRRKPSKGSLMAPHYMLKAQKATERRLHFLIKTIIADGARLEIEPKKESKQSLRFDIAKLTLHSGSPTRALTFNAELTNPKPPGRIITGGNFGPWERDDPRLTPLSGGYTFQHADLSVFKGIRGILSSTGNFAGVLERIDVKGVTKTPDFALQRRGEPLSLDTTFHAIVDGTDGDTILDPVDAVLGNSEFICRGDISHLPGSEGKTISLTAETGKAQMEDILKLILGSAKSMINGRVKFNSKIFIPQGGEPVIDKLQLDGRFAIPSAIFTSPKVEHTLTTLSLRARGIDRNEESKRRYKDSRVASDLSGVFKLKSGVASFSRFSFKVPGATVDLTGNFNLRSQQIDMKGLFRMQATLSDTQSGLKSLALKPLDPFFRKNGAGFQIPVSITGTRDQPVIEASIFRHKVTIH